MIRGIQAAAALAVVLAMLPAGAGAAEAMRVVRDPVTGELRAPNAAEAAALDKADAQLRAGRSSKGQPAKEVVIHHPDGSDELKLGEDSQMYSVVSEGADGALNFDCLPAKEAQAFVAGNKAGKNKQGKAKAATASSTAQGDAHDHH